MHASSSITKKIGHCVLKTTINNTYDFAIGKSLKNLPELRQIGFAANRRLLEIERISHDCILAEKPVTPRFRQRRTPTLHHYQSNAILLLKLDTFAQTSL